MKYSSQNHKWRKSHAYVGIKDKEAMHMFLDDYPLYRGVVTDYLFRMLEPFYSSKSHASMHASVINPYCKNPVGFSLKHISLP